MFIQGSKIISLADVATRYAQSLGQQWSPRVREVTLWQVVARVTRSFALEMPFLFTHTSELIVTRDVDLRPHSAGPSLRDNERRAPLRGQRGALAWLRLRLVYGSPRASRRPLG